MIGTIQHNAASRRQRMATILVAIAWAAATLWDYRVFDLRIFDGMALILLVGFLLIAAEPLQGFLPRRRDGWLLFATIAGYAALGFALHGHRSSLAIILLAAISFALIGRRDWLADSRLFQWLLTAHIVFFIIQFLGFYLLKELIDFQAFIGENSRLNQRIYQIRAAGLFQEPNSYSLNIFVLGTIVALQRANLMLIVLAAGTMTLSESVWGMGAAIVLLFLHALVRYQSPAQMIKGLVIFGLVIGVVFNAYLWLTKQPQEVIPYFYTRVLGVTSDPSTQDRYLRNGCLPEEQAAATKVSAATSTQSWILGEGLSTRFFTECLPANGLSFLLKSFGIAGLVALLAGFALALRGVPPGSALYAALAIGFSFTTYPLVTYVIFWLWLPAIIGLLHRHNSDPDPANVTEA